MITDVALTKIPNDVDGKGTIVVRTDATRYEVFYDEYTGDWGVYSDGDDTIQSPWLRSRDGAVQYVLQHINILEDGDYTFAPDRT